MLVPLQLNDNDMLLPADWFALFAGDSRVTFIVLETAAVKVSVRFVGVHTALLTFSPLHVAPQRYVPVVLCVGVKFTSFPMEFAEIL